MNIVLTNPKYKRISILKVYQFMRSITQHYKPSNVLGFVMLALARTHTYCLCQKHASLMRAAGVYADGRLQLVTSCKVLFVTSSSNAKHSRSFALSFLACSSQQNLRPLNPSSPPTGRVLPLSPIFLMRNATWFSYDQRELENN